MILPVSSAVRLRPIRKKEPDRAQRNIALRVAESKLFDMQRIIGYIRIGNRNSYGVTQVSNEDSKDQLPYGDASLTELAIKGIEEGILQHEYRDKKLPDPDPLELRRIARERYKSSKKNGPDDYLGSAKQ